VIVRLECEGATLLARLFLTPAARDLPSWILPCLPDKGFDEMMHKLPTFLVAQSLGLPPTVVPERRCASMLESVFTNNINSIESSLCRETWRSTSSHPIVCKTNRLQYCRSHFQAEGASTSQACRTRMLNQIGMAVKFTENVPAYPNCWTTILLPSQVSGQIS